MHEVLYIQPALRIIIQHTYVSKTLYSTHMHIYIYLRHSWSFHVKRTDETVFGFTNNTKNTQCLKTKFLRIFKLMIKMSFPFPPLLIQLNLGKINNEKTADLSAHYSPYFHSFLRFSSIYRLVSCHFLFTCFLLFLSSYN